MTTKELKLEALKKERSVITEQMSRLAKYVRQLQPNSDIFGISARQKRANELLKNFGEVEREIFLINPDEASEILIFEDIYYEVISGLNKWSRKTSMNNTDSSLFDTTMNTERSIQVKLPKINIPPFSGEYTEWQSFYDLYMGTIHENTSLSPAQKFQYLKEGLLQGEAASLLKHFSITESNYIEAFKKLCDRYDRKKHSVNAFIRNFVDQPNVGSNLATNLRKLVNTSDEIIRGLHALGEEAEQRDPWLIFMLLNKVDDESKSRWAQETCDVDFPNIDDFLKFLGKRSDAMESLKSGSRRTGSNSKGELSRSFAINSVKCDVCDSSDHFLYQCKEFANQAIDQRRSHIKESKRCFNCLSDTHSVYQCKSKRRCQICTKKHHTLVHLDPSESILAAQTSDVLTRESNDKFQTTSSDTTTLLVQSILPTALVKVKDWCGNRVTYRVLLDTGSQLSFISEACMNRLKLPRMNGRITVSGIGESRSDSTKGITSIQMTSLNNYNSEFHLEVYILPKVTAVLPPSTPHKNDLSLLTGIELADPETNKSKPIDILLGADVVFQILGDGKIRNNKGQIIAQQTLFGWVLVGRQGDIRTTALTLSTISENSADFNIDKCLRAFWELEEIPEKSNWTNEEEECEAHFVANTTRNINGRFVVRLPFKHPKPTLGKPLDVAINRLHAMERKFTKNKEYGKMYKSFMQEYIELGHMVEISTKNVNQDNCVFLPHHGVLKEDSISTKLRVVFDASAKTGSTASLNDALLVGPTIQSSIFEIILRFRERAFVMSADIVKMYRQILLNDEDQKNQCIVWRSNQTEPIRFYKLKTVTYGTAAAPFLATRVIRELARLNQNTYPAAASALNANMYVDDLMTGTNDLRAAITLKDDIIKILKTAGMQLSKWSSNSAELMSTVPEHQRASHSREISEYNPTDQSSKVLGLHWDSYQDRFRFTVHLSSTKHLTKRIMLSESSKIFDPLGWLAPTTVRFKILLQSLWLSKLERDENLSSEIISKWTQITDDLNASKEVVLPRWLLAQTMVNNLEIHAFCDASEMAYAAAVYLRATYPDGRSSVNLVVAKTRVAPIKQVSIPRLELCAALLLSKLVLSVQKATTLSVNSVTAWTDSQIVLDWLSSHPRKWTNFVGNRTSKIIQHISRDNWRHVPSKANPADCASRGMPIQLLQQHDLWWYGPEWLSKDKNCWPVQNRDSQDTCEESRPIKVNTFAANIDDDLLDGLIRSYSSYDKLLLVLSWIRRFVTNCRQRRNRLPYQNSNGLHRLELMKSEVILNKYTQRKFFSEEVQLLHKGQPVNRNSKLIALAPFIDEYGVIRVGGRIEQSSAPYETKHPTILPNNSELVKLIIRQEHMKQGHAGISLLINTLRQRFWILRIKTVAREIIRSCTICCRHRGRTEVQSMAELPDFRVQFVRPFMTIGIDYAGPISIYPKRGRGQRVQKAYIAMFVCTSVKAVHIELVHDLTTEAFLAALRRFIARRGFPCNIYSDNGSNFIGANRELKEVWEMLTNNKNIISKFLLGNRINWHFNPPSAPHFGGLWEAAVKSAKFHLKRIIGCQILTTDEMQTVLTQIEAMLNSRPLCKGTDNEIDVLTPSHFLLGHSMTYIPEVDITSIKQSMLSRWQHVQQLSQHFWNRWQKEYLVTLQKRAKWHTETSNILTEDIVILADERCAPSKWSLGKVQRTFPGKDGKIRVAEVKTSSGTFKRPITKLVKLPTGN